jgi:diadenosine tetraphosphate (Ap4A) HIT family hydrolase
MVRVVDKNDGVTPSPQDFHDRAVAAADAEGRLPLPEQAMWEIFPFEPDSLRVKPLDPLTLPEPPRNGEGGAGCWRCTYPDESVVWANERWTLMPFDRPRLPFAAMLMPRAHLDLGDLDDAMAAELGVLAVRVVRAVEALDAIGRVHLNKFGDGGAHLHAFLLGRPAGLLQLRGSNLALWEEMFPVVPHADAAAVVAVAVDALADLGESRL